MKLHCARAFSQGERENLVVYHFDGRANKSHEYTRIATKSFSYYRLHHRLIHSLTDSLLPLGLRLKLANGFPWASNKPLPKGKAPKLSCKLPLPDLLPLSDWPEADDNFRICSSIASTLKGVK